MLSHTPKRIFLWVKIVTKRKEVVAIAVNGTTECYVVNDLEIVYENVPVSNILGLCCEAPTPMLRPLDPLSMRMCLSSSIIHQPRTY
jgi:hypothetical protein